MAGPNMWHSLPTSVWSTGSLAAFRKQLIKLISFICITHFADTGLYFIALTGFKLSCLKLYFTA